MRKPATAADFPGIKYVEPTRIKRGGTVVDGREIVAATESDYFDLTVLSADDEDSTEGKEGHNSVGQTRSFEAVDSSDDDEVEEEDHVSSDESEI